MALSRELYGLRLLSSIRNRSTGWEAVPIIAGRKGTLCYKKRGLDTVK